MPEKLKLKHAFIIKLDAQDEIIVDVVDDLEKVETVLNLAATSDMSRMLADLIRVQLMLTTKMQSVSIANSVMVQIAATDAKKSKIQVV